MNDYYHHNYQAYHEKTFHIDPSSFLEPLAGRLPPEGFILDVGCGSGRDLMWMKKQGFEVIGFERSLGLAELARENAGCEVIEADFETYDFSAIMVDAVMLVGALVHLPHDRFREVFENITSALSENGSVLLTLKEGEGSRKDSDGRIFYLWQDDEIRELLDRSAPRKPRLLRRGRGELYEIDKKSLPGSPALYGGDLQSLGFKICDFSKSVSKTESGDVWLSYVLEKQ